MGNRIYESFSQNLDVDTILTSKVNQFSKFIDFDTDYPLHFTVVDDDEINAFALPGGNIIIFNGILEKMKSKEELAALMSHEVSHVKLRHSFKSMCRSLSGYLFISFLFGDVNAVAAILIENSNNIYNLKYSRELEEEADNNAVKILNANHINLKGMVDLFTMLDTYNKNNLKIPYFLSTHPLTKDRLSNAKTALKNQPNIIENKELEGIWMNIYLIEKFNNF